MELTHTLTQKQRNYLTEIKRELESRGLDNLYILIKHNWVCEVLQQGWYGERDRAQLNRMREYYQGKGGER